MPVATQLTFWGDEAEHQFPWKAWDLRQSVEEQYSQIGGSGVRDSQDITLVPNKPTTANVRNSQDISLLAYELTTQNVRNSQDIVLVVVQSPFVAQLVFFDDDARDQIPTIHFLPYASFQETDDIGLVPTIPPFVDTDVHYNNFVHPQVKVFSDQDAEQVFFSRKKTIFPSVFVVT